MQELDQQQARAILKDRGTRFLEYLAAVSQTFATRTPRRVEDSPECILSSQIPNLPNLITIGPSSSSHAWFAIKQPNKPKPVYVPTELKPYVDQNTIRKTTQTPKLNAQYHELKKSVQTGTAPITPDIMQTRARIRHIDEIFNAWQATTWTTWVTQTAPYEQAFTLYQKLFDLYLRLDKESDNYELLFGHCILTWAGRASADYPLVLTDAHMIFKEQTGTILIETVAPSRMSVAPFEGTDLPGYNLLLRYQDTFNDNPVDLWNPQSEEALFDYVAKQLGASSHINTELNLKPGEDPVLQHGWCLLLRKRTDNTSAFYRGLSKKLQESDYLPEAFDAMFSDISVVRIATGKQDEHTPMERLLMPLPANADQRRIIEQLSRNSGVTVQGPPGTGKSHTIVNLISHLLAHGKRVLVTAEKAQALAVLRDKIPNEIRDFAVASIGESTADTETLRLSVQRMQDSLSDVDIAATRRSISQWEQIIDASDGRLEAINQELVRRLERQTDEYDTPEGRKNAAQTAQWLAANTSHNIIPDHVLPASKPPLRDGEYAEYVALARELSQEDIAQSALTLPTIDMLPSATELSSMQAQLDAVHSQVSDLERSGLDLHAVDEASTEQLQASLHQLHVLRAELASLDGTWERALGRQLRSNAQQRAWLEHGITVLQQQIDRATELSGLLLGHTISVPDGNPKEQHDLLAQWTERIQQGKGLPRVFNKDLREFGESVKVDGYVPQTRDELRLVESYIDQQRLLAGLPALTRQTFDGLSVPDVDIAHASLSAISGMVHRIASINTWWNERYPIAVHALRPYFPFRNPADDIEEFNRAVTVLESSVARRTEQEIQQRLESVKSMLEQHTRTDDSPLWQQMLDALYDRDYDAWQNAAAESIRLARVKQQAERLTVLHDRLASVAPQWADAIRQTHADPQICGDPQSYAFAWNLAQAESWLNEITDSSDVTALLTESRAITKQRHEATLQVVGLSARLHLKLTQDPDARTALNIWLDAMKRYGKGTGKNAENYLATARHELPKAMNAMPVWIMPLHKVMDNFNPAISQLFDVIIVDESSQCDLLSVGVLALARKAVIVGDDKQTSPSNAFKSVGKMIALQNRYIPDIPGKALLTFDDSLYTMSNRVFQSQIMLREHFRCVPEIIDYSNRFYDRQIFPLRERSHPEIGSPLQARYVPNAQTVRIGNDIVNQTEAQAIANQIRQCCADPRYDGMTFGVVSLRSSEAHQKVLSDRIVEAIGAEEYAKRRLRVGNPPAFQGDERNVMFLSCVTDLAGGHAYAATGLRDAQWANVAASRAQDQLWVFYSMNPSELNANDVYRGLIEYVRDYAVEEADNNPMSDVRTDFERAVLRQLVDHGYGSMVHVHYRVGRYSIDCVVTVAKGMSLAIECDGDEEKTPEAFAEDITKQRVLERLGWQFIRLSAPAYYQDAQATMQPVFDQLNELMESRTVDEAAIQPQPEYLKSDQDMPKRAQDAISHDQSLEVQSSEDQSSEIAESSEPSSSDVTPVGDMSSDDAHFEHSLQTDESPVVIPAVHMDTPDSVHPTTISKDSPEDTDSDDYLLIEYGSLVESADIPPQGVEESDGKWLQATLYMLIANEYPLSDGLLRKQIVPLLVKKGFSTTYANRRIDGAQEFLRAKHWVLRAADDFYYPEPIQERFRIIRGRDVADVSVVEVAFVIRQLSLVPQGKRRNALELQLDRIYGWNAEDLSKCALVDQAFRLLQTSGLAEEHQGRIIPSHRSLEMETKSPLVWDELENAISNMLSAEYDQVSVASRDVVAKMSVASLPAENPTAEKEAASAACIDEDSQNQESDIATHKRVFTKYGERYHLRYAEPVPINNLPLREDYTNVEEWLMEILIKLVYSEYPVCYAMLDEQLAKVLEQAGIPESSVDDLLHECLDRCADHIRKKSDGFYYPVDEKHYPFRIIRHREIGFISIWEIAFIMRQILRDHPGRSKDWLFDETFAVYGFRAFGRKINSAFEAAYRYLIRSHYIADRDDKISLLSSHAS